MFKRKATVPVLVLLLLVAGAALVSPAAAERASQPSNVQAGYIDLGASHSCARLTNGSVRCWGLNGNGQLGYGNTVTIGDTETPAAAGPVNLGTGRTATQLAAGDSSTCAILDNASVRCWGSGGFGALGYGSTEDVGNDESVASKGPVNLGSGRTAKAIAVGASHACAILDTDALRCWGQGGDGALGYGNGNSIGDDPMETPASAGPVSLGTTAKAVTAGIGFTCVLRTDGGVVCFGQNGFGQLGQGSAIPSSEYGDDSGEVPSNLGTVNLGINRTASAISSGSQHTCVILATPVADAGKVMCWGLAASGRLGYNDGANNIGDNESPFAAGTVNLGGHTAVAVAAGGAHTCVILDDGSVRCWGFGSSGQTGQNGTANVGDDASRPAPGVVVNIGAGRTATAVATGYFHTCVRRDDNSVICFGRNEAGQLGYANTTNIGDTEVASAGGPVNLGSTAPPDSDGDGKPNSTDACDFVAGSTPNGCPNVTRSLTLRYASSAFRGTLSSAKAACRSSMIVTVFKKVGTIGGSDDVRQGQDTTSATGAFVLTKVRKPGTYYASTLRRVVPSAGNCLAARSPLLTLP